MNSLQDSIDAKERTEAIGPPSEQSPAVVFEHVSFAFDEQVILRDVCFSIGRGSMRVVLGASGSGKSVMLKLMLGLLRPDSGAIWIHGSRIDRMDERDLMHVRSDIGMMFQENALFDSLTVAENVGYRLYEEMNVPPDRARQRVQEVLGFVGLEEYTDRMPAELSGGQRRRVAIARAMASKPQLLLFDDPTSGLDPITASTVDDQIVKLRDVDRVTAVVATHQIRDAFYLASHRVVRTNGRLQMESLDEPDADGAVFMVLNDGKIYFEGNGSELRASGDGYLRQFLHMTLPPW